MRNYNVIDILERHFGANERAENAIRIAGEDKLHWSNKLLARSDAFSPSARGSQANEAQRGAPVALIR